MMSADRLAAVIGGDAFDDFTQRVHSVIYVNQPVGPVGKVTHQRTQPRDLTLALPTRDPF